MKKADYHLFLPEVQFHPAAVGRINAFITRRSRCTPVNRGDS